MHNRRTDVQMYIYDSSTTFPTTINSIYEPPPAEDITVGLDNILISKFSNCESRFMNISCCHVLL